MRVRLFYEKRGFACFVPHVALSTLFARAARRAGIVLSSTEGFSQRAKISFGPELPAGVVALNEPVDLWLNKWDSQGAEPLEQGVGRSPAETLPDILSAQMPEGFRVTKCILPAEGAPVLGKECGAAHYLLWVKNGFSAAELLLCAQRFYGESVLSGFVEQTVLPRVSIVLANPAQNGIGGFVKSLAADEAVDGWHDMRIVRKGLGRWNGKRMEPMEEGCGTER